MDEPPSINSMNGLAALPQNSAERLCLSGEGSLTEFEAVPQTSAAQPQINKISANGKPEAYRTVLRQSRAESELRRNLYSEQMK
jgi:hypothetical protein